THRTCTAKRGSAWNGSCSTPRSNPPAAIVATPLHASALAATLSPAAWEESKKGTEVIKRACAYGNLHNTGRLITSVPFLFLQENRHAHRTALVDRLCHARRCRLRNHAGPARAGARGAGGAARRRGPPGRCFRQPGP